VAYAVLARNHDGAILLQRRPPTGLWGGLWTFPQFEAHADALTWVQQRFHVSAQSAQLLGAYEHAFTHFDLTLHPLLMSVIPVAHAVADEDGYVWYDSRSPARIGLAKPAVDLLRTLQKIPVSDGERDGQY
jgi:A/G-specific adenine glycosylase